ncbi:unnamed protein product [Brassica oleracea]|uniref:Uncharacterized protein n=2 Tax=Brassica TaxID=3705 RepID=A0A0D3D6D6_BRAOL|nr:unnamed protein product [Brassica napus]
MKGHMVLLDKQVILQEQYCSYHLQRYSLNLKALLQKEMVYDGLLIPLGWVRRSTA